MNQNVIALVGRILLAAIFIISGFGKITGWDGTAAYMASKGLPMVQVLLALTIAIELGGGILLAIGYKARWAAFVIFLFTIPVTFVFHNFWAVDPAQVQMQQINFLKNLAMMGGLLMVVAFGPGTYSVDKG
jgi:putative oxidoreductase